MIRFREHILENIGGYLLVGFFFLIWVFNSDYLRSDYKLGNDALESGEYSVALDYLIPLAMEGDMRAQYLLGYMYGEGLGVREDKEVEFKAYKKSADQGYKRAQFALGYMYHQGEFVSKDINKAISYYKLAGDSEATFYLAELYYENNIISEDIFAWYKEKAEGNNEGAQFYLGEIYYTGKYTPKDYGKAAHWYRKAVIGQSRFNWANLTLKDVRKKCVHIRELEEVNNKNALDEKISKWYHENGRQLFRRCVE